jgi:hypothetical protein
MNQMVLADSDQNNSLQLYPHLETFIYIIIHICVNVYIYRYADERERREERGKGDLLLYWLMWPRTLTICHLQSRELRWGRKENMSKNHSLELWHSSRSALGS